MRVFFTDPFLRQLKKLPNETKRKLKKQITFLLINLQHPSLRAKKYDEARDIWQARVDGYYRFYFKIDDDTYIIVGIIKHPK